MARDASVANVVDGFVLEYTTGGRVEKLAGCEMEETDEEGKRVEWLSVGRRLDWPLKGKSVWKPLAVVASATGSETA